MGHWGQAWTLIEVTGISSSLTACDNKGCHIIYAHPSPMDAFLSGSCRTSVQGGHSHVSSWTMHIFLFLRDHCGPCGHLLGLVALPWLCQAPYFPLTLECPALHFCPSYSEVQGTVEENATLFMCCTVRIFQRIATSDLKADSFCQIEVKIRFIATWFSFVFMHKFPRRGNLFWLALTNEMKVQIMCIPSR